MSASLEAAVPSTKAERAPLLSKAKVSPLPRALDIDGGHGFSSGNDDADIDTSGTSIRSASDAVTFDAMMQLSAPRNLLQHAKVRAFVLWLTTSAILFLTNQLTTLPVGFFPAYAQQHFGMTTAQLSLFFAVYPLCIMLSSPLAASVSPAVGRQTVICVGLVLSGSTTIAFAYTSAIPTLFILRVLQGIGSGAAVVGAFSMITEEFSASIGQILAIQEFVVAAAFVTAPPIGSLLFQLQGYQLPFLASGVVQILLVMLVPVLFIEYSLPDGLYARGPMRNASLYLLAKCDAIGFRDVLTPTCVICLLSTVFAMASFGFIDPYLGSHLQAVLGAQHFAVGLGFALSAFVYFLGGVVYVWLSRNCGCKQVILFGLFQLCVGFFFLGPPPFMDAFFKDYNRLWFVQWLSLVFIGCGAALAIAPGLPLTLMSVATAGPQAFNLVIGLFSAAVYLGQALGPFIALLLLAVLPHSHSLNCFASKENAFQSCESALPWAFTVYSLLAAVVFALVAWKLPTGEAIVELLQNNRRHLSLARQTSEYGQFVFFDEEDFADEDDSRT